jgi:hypothetical protein
MVMNFSIFWDVARCNPSADVTVEEIASVIKFVEWAKQEISRASMITASCLLLVWLILRKWRWRWHVPLKFRLTLSGLNGFVSRKIEFFAKAYLCCCIPHVTCVLLGSKCIFSSYDILFIWNLHKNCRRSIRMNLKCFFGTLVIGLL